MLPGLPTDLNHPILRRWQAERVSRRPLVDFVRLAWREVESRPYQHNWHITALCDHLEAINRGECRALVALFPPRHSKSLITTVFWPAWTWLARRAGMPLSGPRVSFAFASWSASLSTDHNLMLRRLVDTIWYRHAAGEQFSIDSQGRSGRRFSRHCGGASLCHLGQQFGHRLRIRHPGNR